MSGKDRRICAFVASGRYLYKPRLLKLTTLTPLDISIQSARINMGKITVFALETCPYCKKAKALLKQKGADFEEISITAKPEWRQYMFLLTNGEHADLPMPLTVRLCTYMFCLC